MCCVLELTPFQTWEDLSFECVAKDKFENHEEERNQEGDVLSPQCHCLFEESWLVLDDLIDGHVHKKIKFNSLRSQGSISSLKLSVFHAVAYCCVLGVGATGHETPDVFRS